MSHHKSMNIFQVAEKWEVSLIVIINHNIVPSSYHQNGQFIPFVFPDMQMDVLAHHICSSKRDVPISVLDEYG